MFKRINFKFLLIIALFAIIASPFTASADRNVWSASSTNDVYATGEIKEADVIAGTNGVYNHLARSVTISLLANTGLSAYDTSSTSACSSSLLGDKTSPILPPFKMRIYNASTTPVIYRTIYSNPGGVVATATSADGFIPFSSQVYETTFFTVPNWTLSPSANATLTVEIFTKGY